MEEGAYVLQTEDGVERQKLMITAILEKQDRIGAEDLPEPYDRGTEAEKQYSSMLEDYKKANEEYKKLVESANDQAVSSEEREKRKKSAETKVLELNEIEKIVAVSHVHTIQAGA